jgi:hypothetical protein
MMSRVIGASLGIALSLQSASAAVVVYDNSDGTFGWQIGLRDLSGIQRYGTYLDITQPPTQSGEKRPGTITKWYRANSSSSEPAYRYVDGEGGVETAETTNIVKIIWNDEILNVYPARDYQAGEAVQSTDRWGDQSTYYWHLPFSSDLTTGTPGISTDAYLGVRVKMADNQWHYGWIRFIDYRTPIAWAYETEPNVPIQIPVPSPGIASISLVLSGIVLRMRNRP